MRSFGRRQLLRITSLLGLGLALGACTPHVQDAPAVPTEQPAFTPLPPQPTSTLEPPTLQPVSEGGTTPAAPPSLTPPSPTPAPAGAADVAVVHGEDPQALVQTALQLLGGIQRFVQPGYDVIIKPNICNANHGPEYASTTNPLVIATLVRLCLEAGAAQVRVMDNPFAGSAENAYVSSQVDEAVAAAGGTMEIMAPHRFVDAEIPEGRDIHNWRFYKPILDADLVINVPIAKHHGSARLTLGCKNIMGCVEDRGGIHRNLGQRIADLVSRVRPQLTVIDATRILVANGPTGGSLDDVVQANTIIASQDVVAADAWATSLFGRTPQEIAYIVAAHEMGLGTMDLSTLNVVEQTV
ncbi:MAG: DUF362 domain-containing protein [Anaerolineae bacterium]|jgi:uncharacterized protein (DUF362 family)|nr:DUF362 domain-containing protein [Chloroflexota bacterium]